MILANAKRYGFTIVELLIVVLIIGILTSVSIVAYNGVQKSARDTSVLSDMDAIDGIQTDYGIKNGVGGVAYNSANPEDVALLGFSPSSGNVIDVVTDGTDYCIRGYNPAGTKDSIDNAFTRESTEGACGWLPAGGGPPIALNCPSGFIVVPGNSTFSTSDFCVAKYEMKIAGDDNGNQTYNSSFVPESRASGTPWVNISQTDAIAEAQTVPSCIGCHLITENEWMTIVANVLSVSSNWSGGAVGSGYIYSGHNDNVPANSLAASSNDTDGFFGTGQSGTSSQRRTLTLTNGEVIWDFAGNVLDWTAGTISGGQHPGLSGETTYASKEWTNPALLFNGFPASSRPSAISGTVAGYSSAQGIGRLYSNYGNISLNGYVRGGSWGSSLSAGVLSLHLYASPSGWSTGFGFRVSQ